MRPDRVLLDVVVQAGVDQFGKKRLLKDEAEQPVVEIKPRLEGERFVDALVDTGKVNREFLPFDQGQRLTTWGKMVTVENNLELGILSVTVKGSTARDVSRIMDGVSQVLTEKNMLFRGGDEKSIEIRILSGPILTQNPTMTQILKVVVAAFLAGVFIAAFFMIVRSEASYRPLLRDDEAPLNEMLV